MYPKNAASPPRISVGAVVQISDGAVQTSGVSIKVRPEGGTASAGSNSPVYEEGIVLYTPTQAETNYTAFVVLAYKTGCIPVAQTIVTTASSTAGKVDVSHVGGTAQTAGDICAAIITNAAGTDIAADIIALKSDTAAILMDTGTDGVVLPQAQADKVWGTAARTLTAFSFTVAADLVSILGTALTETAGYLAAAFKKFFNVSETATPAASAVALEATSGSIVSTLGIAGDGLTVLASSAQAQQIVTNTNLLYTAILSNIGVSPQGWDGSQATPVVIEFSGTASGSFCFCLYSGAPLFYWDAGTGVITPEASFTAGPWADDGILSLDYGTAATISVGGALTLTVKDSTGTAKTFEWVLPAIANASGWYPIILTHDGRGFAYSANGWGYLTLAAPLTAAQTRTALGLASANLDTQLAAPVTLANGAHGGAAATLALKSVVVNNNSGVGVDIQGTVQGLKVVGSAGDGAEFSSSAADGFGIVAVGTGVGDGLYVQGGTTGSGLNAAGGVAGVGALFEGGGSNKEGLKVLGKGTASGVYVQGGATNGNGLLAEGQGTGKDINAPDSDISLTLKNGVTHGGATAVLQLERVIVASTTTNEPGVKITGNGYGDGISTEGGADNGSGLRATGGGVVGVGIEAIGAVGTTPNGGNGLVCAGYGAGNGIHTMVTGSGSGILAIGGETNGSGIMARGFAVGSGLHVTGGNGGGTGDGLYARSQGTGKDINAPDSDIGVTGGAGLTAQQTRDALKLPPSAGAPAAGSIDSLLNTIKAE